MHRPRPVPLTIDPEEHDLRAGGTALVALLGLNGLLVVLLVVSALGGSVWLWQVPVFILALEGLFFVAVFLPMLLYRVARKKESLKLAASRSLLWFSEALGLAV
jgi:hypothetical protein